MNLIQYGFFNELEKLGYDFQELYDIGYGGINPTPVSPMSAAVDKFKGSVSNLGTALKGAVPAMATGGVSGGLANYAFGATPTQALGAGALGATATGLASTLKPALNVVRDAGNVAVTGVRQAGNQVGQAVGGRVQSGVAGARAGMAAGTNPVGRAAGAVSGFTRGLFKRAALRRHLMMKLAAMENAGEAMSSIKRRLYNPFKSGMLGYHVNKKHFNKIRAANPNMSSSDVGSRAYKASSDQLSKMRKRFPL